ncbi:AbrB/MazE/SpoVT family DNA-binding domain-containing protein [Enterovirga rhinocerotis]|uniref:Antitoxin MazE n=1 Tax=Enterovirga rhinocerotis TaxID=1339210 RepID=A0A4R7BU83_9HYPH|nr:AbrB/MazE/SpoVT family DNA-binding domain-containing protein [Enterovirga rhinocerotis]TDR89061.1 antitoxin MazE [Enterovirga rhinocerotis]
MKAKVSRWGNSLAVRLPAEVVRDLGLREGQVLELSAKDATIQMTSPSVRRRRVNGIPVYSLDELVAEARRLGPGHEPEMVNWGPDRGSEIIDDEYSRGEITLDDLLHGRASQSR